MDLMTCEACTGEKKRNQYNKNMRMGLEPPVCNWCTHGKGIYSERGLAKSKGKIFHNTCISCDTEFKTTQDYRICTVCKKQDAWKEGHQDWKVVT